MRLLSKCCLYIAIVLLVFTGSGKAQVFWMQSYDNTGAGLEFHNGMGGRFKGERSSYTFFLNCHYRLSPKLMTVLQLSYSVATFHGWFNSFSSVVGNPYIGVEMAKQNTSSYVLQAGVRLPIATSGDYARFDARASFFVNNDQFDATIARALSIQGFGGLQVGKIHDNGSGFLWKTVLGGLFIKPEKHDADLFANLYTQVSLSCAYARLIAGATIRANVTDDIPDFSDRLFGETGVRLMGVLGAFRPSAGVKFPITNTLRSDVDFIYMVGIGVDVN